MIIIRTLTFIVLFVILFGCTKDTERIDLQTSILAIVRNDTISANDLRSYLATNGKINSQTLSIQKLHAKLDDLVHDRIIAAYGYDNKLFDNPEIMFELRTKRDELFYQKFLREYVYAPMVSESQMRDFYSKLKTEVRARQILIRYIQEKEITIIDKSKVTRFPHVAKALADSLYSELLRQPGVFPALAEGFSDDENSKFLSGDIGFLRFGETDPLFEEVVFSLKDGEISKPWDSGKGFHILMVTEHREVNNLKSYEEAKEGILDMSVVSVVRNKGNLIKQRINALSDSLLKKYNFEIKPANIDVYLHRHQSIKKPGEIISVFSNEELALPLASYDNGQIQILELVLVMKDNSSKVKLNDGLVQIGLRSVASRRIISELAQGQGYTLTPSEKTVLQNAERTMMKNLALVHLDEGVEASDVEVKKYYDDNNEQYREAGMLDVKEIWSQDQADLNTLADEVRRGISFDSVFQKANSIQKIKTKRTGLVRDDTKDIIIMKAQKLKPGENSEPFQNIFGGYSMIKLIERREGEVLPFETAKNRVVMDCLNFKRKIAYDEWIANLSVQYKVRIFSDRLKNVFDPKMK